MRKFLDLPIQRKMLVMTLIICGAVLLVAFAALFTFQVLNFRSNFQRDTATLAAIIANNSTAALDFKDQKGATEVIASLQAKPTVLAASLVLPDGVTFACFGREEAARERSQYPLPGKFRFVDGHLLYTQPVVLEKKLVGTLFLRLDYNRTFVALIKFYGIILTGVMIVSITLAVFLSGRLRRIITDPVLRLAQTAQLVGEQKDYSLRVASTNRRDELGSLTESFNEMLSRIETQDLALKESQERFKVAMEKFEALVNSIDGIVWECDTELKFSFVSPQSERILGYAPAQWLANPNFWQEHVHSEDAVRALQTCRDSIAGKKPYNHEYRMISADGRTVWIRESGDVLLHNGGQPALVRGILQDITEQKLAAAELDKLNKQLVTTSRQAGMAEVATGVLHNVGNVLNSVNVSTTLIREKLQSSEVASLVKVGGLLQQHQANLSTYLTADPRGKLVPGFIIQLAEQLGSEHALLQSEQAQLARNIEHIKEIVAMQQNYARVSGVLERVCISDLVDDALQLNTAGLTRHGVQVVRNYEHVPQATADKHKVLQILVNLMHNAKYALDECGREDKKLTVCIGMNGDKRVRISVSDNGVGIPQENLTRIFAHGFSTRKGGHGFGLHSGANAAKEMGGQLSVQSEGLGKGATFILELPLGGERTESVTTALAE